MAQSELGEFLRARREQTSPAAVGLPEDGLRRVRGLRREEVAVLAGVSADYYARLEQGRERRPSGQIIEGISRALRLGHDAREHLSRLAELRPRISAADIDVVSPHLWDVLDSMRGVAAYVVNLRLDFLATNAVTKALFTPFRETDNSARLLFLDPLSRQVIPDWEPAARNTVEALRMAMGACPHDPGLVGLVESLSAQSADFQAMWSENVAQGLTTRSKIWLHPQYGRLELIYQAFEVREAPGQQLVTFSAEPDSDTALVLARIASAAD